MRSCSGPAVASSKFSPSVPVTNQRLYRYNVIPSVCTANRLSNCTLHVWCSSLEQHFVLHFAYSVHMYRCIVVLCYAVEDNEHFLSFAFLYLAPFVSTIFLPHYSLSLPPPPPQAGGVQALSRHLSHRSTRLVHNILHTLRNLSDMATKQVTATV